MRILQVRFKNLNSLVGEWEIDLTHPRYASDGLFAITGPTGAGKTTILDAICLALYGRTPRLNKMTKGNNEIMSRQTGECFSEVTFETQAGRYRCHWSQRRARKNPGGELQAPKHEIANAVTGEIFEAKIRGVADQIEAATGMDFDQFTRSMLLAQGGFAVFLQAAPDERAPVLEQITGTEIYSQISIRVHERRSDERKKLEVLLAELAGMRFLTSEEELQLNDSLALKNDQEQELHQKIDQKTQTVIGLESIVRLEEELRQLARQKEDVQNRIEAFAPGQEKLRLAHLALELAGDYATLLAIRREQEADQRTLRESVEILPEKAVMVEQVEEKTKAASEYLEKKKLEQQQMLPLIRKVRELDINIANKKASVEAANAAIREYLQSLEKIQSNHNEGRTRIESFHNALREVRLQQEVAKPDEALVEYLAGLLERFEIIQNVYSQWISKRNEMGQAESALQESLLRWQEQSIECENSKRRLYDIQIRLAGKQSELYTLLENKELANWRKYQLELTERKNMFAKATDIAQNLLTSKQALDDSSKKKITLSSEEVALRAQLERQAQWQSALEDKTSLLEVQLTLIKKIEDFSTIRHQLQDGKPCPLCGAREHPFAEGSVPAPNEVEQQLIQAKGDLRLATETVADLKRKQFGLTKDFERLVVDQDELVEKLRDAEQGLVEIGSILLLDLGSSVSDAQRDQEISRLQEDNYCVLASVTQKLEDAEVIEKELKILHGLQEQAKEWVVRAEHEVQAAFYTKETTTQRFEQLKSEVAEYQNQQQSGLGLLCKEVEPFGVEIQTIDDLDTVYEQLVLRRDLWVERQKKQVELDKEITALDIQVCYQAEQIQRYEQELDKQQHQRNNVFEELEKWMGERQSVFGDKTTEEEEERLSTDLDKAFKEWEEIQQKWVSVNDEFNQLKFKVTDWEKAIEHRGAQLALSEEAFLARIRKAGFSDEEGYTLACMPENERYALMQHAQQLSDERVGVMSKEKEKKQLLEMEQQKYSTTEPLEGVRNTLVTLRVQQKELQLEIGAIGQRLQDNNMVKQQQQERLEVVEVQQRECSRWDLLHELIGSADGKKYRNFAQGLTFDIMVGHANRQLQKMTDRYLLTRDHVQPLELNVVDNYQAGEIRSTKNLSGGESFIVSLSLALGLSQMSSKNVRVDSLFLDEGFGTLDEDALETALETLAGLQQEGKLIGIISHVPALKERISVQIQVIPRSGGKSSISGPGCRNKP